MTPGSSPPGSAPPGSAPGTAPAWSDSELSHNPHEHAEKARRVERMFAAIAHRYDLNNRLHSFWRDQAWRRAAVKMADLHLGDVVLDVACGTGDLSQAFHSRGLARRVIGIDFTPAMLDVAMSKRRTSPMKEPTSFLSYHAGDATRLPVETQSADVVSIAFGIRNVADPRKAIAEFHRVLKPGGRLIILEFSTPKNPVIRFFDRIYREKVMPVTATWIAGDKSGAYKYLPRSVDTFLDREGMAAMLRDVGFTDVVMKPMTFGVAVIYRGIKQ